MARDLYRWLLVRIGELYATAILILPNDTCVPYQDIHLSVTLFSPEKRRSSLESSDNPRADDMRLQNALQQLDVLCSSEAEALDKT